LSGVGGVQPQALTAGTTAEAGTTSRHGNQPTQPCTSWWFIARGLTQAVQHALNTRECVPNPSPA